jgi:type IV pilus assembly protein PilQ
MNQLGMAQEGDIIRIATLETLKKEDDLRKAKLEAYRKAREDVKALEPLVTRYIPISYSNAATEVKPHLDKILTKDRGSVSVDAKNNQIIINDTLEVVRQAESIVRRIDKVTSQVVIEARVVEVNENFSRELGITWDMDYGTGVLGDFAVGTDMLMDFPSQGNSNIGISFSRLTGVPFVLNARLNALETNGEGKILSSPKILTLDNKKAKIKQGVEYPYLERDSSGGSSVKFKNIDLLLEVTPHVTPDNRVSLMIYITKNDVAGITAGVPSVATNEAETELLVNDSDTIVIGGIIKSSETSGQDGFPLLKNIPVLGWLFKNKTTTKQSNELLIFITPRIVQLEQVVAQQ